MNPFRKYGLDPQLADGGVVVEFDGMKFTLRHSDRRLQYIAGALALKHRDLFSGIAEDGKAGLAIEVEDSLMQEAMFDSRNVIAWEGIEDDGGPLEFTRDNWLRLVRACPRVWEFLRSKRDDLATFRAQEVAEDLQNFSDGKSNGESTQSNSEPSPTAA